MNLKMGDKKPQLSNPWGTISTVTTFDRGDNARSTILLDTENNRNNGQVVNTFSASTSLLIGSLVQQLCILFEGDPVCRKNLYFAICNKLCEMNLIDSSFNLLEFEPLRLQYQQALYHLFTVARAATGCDNTLQIPSPLITEWSRYHKEFQEISFIAAGGFGHVFKALNRLDGIEYAVKKIVVRSDRIKSIMQHLEEVKTLAKLNHTNIISYKGAWIEPTLSSTFIPRLISTNHSQNKLSSIEHKKRSRYKSYTNQIYSTQNSSNIEFAQSSKEDDKQDMLSQNSKEINSKSEELLEENITRNMEVSDSSGISFRNDDVHQDSITENSTNCTSSNLYEEHTNNKILPYVSQTNRKYTTLYIQMALCDKTLQQWLDERVEISSQTIIVAILTQILHGLDYIHSRGVVHHDIKPSNIFISTLGQLQIQLGDFGLACPLQRETHHSILGTHTYAAPEQLQGKCDPKSDIYSLGIVLLELLVHTRTQMERIEIINEVKRGQIPTTLTATFPKWAHIVSQLVQEDPIKRPTTSQLLQDLNENKDITIACLKSDNAEQNDTIKKLRERISLLEEYIVKHNLPLLDI